MLSLWSKLTPKGNGCHTARFIGTIGASALTTGGLYGGFLAGFHCANFFSAVGASGAGLKNSWEPILFSFALGLFGGGLGAGTGALSYPVIYGGTNLALTAFPGLKELETKVPKEFSQRRVAIRTSRIMAVLLLIYDIVRLRELGLCFSIPAFTYIWWQAAKE